jgi:hypothetical protein
LWIIGITVPAICLYPLFVCLFWQPSIGLLIMEVYISHNNAPQSVGLLWTSDQLIAETSTWQHTTLTTDRCPCPSGIRTHNLSRRAATRLMGGNPIWIMPEQFDMIWTCSRLVQKFMCLLAGEAGLHHVGVCYDQQEELASFTVRFEMSSQAMCWIWNWHWGEWVIRCHTMRPGAAADCIYRVQNTGLVQML